MRRAFSLIELMVCLGIIVIVVAITLPVLAKSKSAALKTQTISNLRQLYIALAIYREEYDGAEIGNLYQLGLPPIDYYAAVIARGLKPPLSGRYPGLGWYYMMPPEPIVAQPAMVQEWNDYNLKCASASIMLVDVNFSDHPPLGGSPLLTSIGFGVRLNGGLARKTERGSPLSYNWWGCTP